MFAGVIVTLGPWIDWLRPFSDIEAFAIVVSSALWSATGASPIDWSDPSTATDARILFSMLMISYGGLFSNISARIFAGPFVPKDVEESDAYKSAVAASHTGSQEGFAGKVFVWVGGIYMVVILGAFLLGLMLITAEWFFGATNSFSEFVAWLSPGLYRGAKNIAQSLIPAFVLLPPLIWLLLTPIAILLLAFGAPQGVKLSDADGRIYIFEIPGARKRMAFIYFLNYLPIMLALLCALIHVAFVGPDRVTG